MYSTEEYLIGWLVYIFGVACVLSCLWYLLRGSSKRIFVQCIMVTIMVFLLTPIESHRDTSYLAPALFVSFYEGLTGVNDEPGVERGLAPILAITVLALSLYGIVRFLFIKLKKPPPVRDRPVYSSDKRRRSAI